jgi:heat shock protein HtpX
MNTLKTTLLLAALTGLLVFVGYAIGGLGGGIIFLILAGIMNFVAYWFSDKFALRMAGAREVTEAEEPQLHQMVREVATLSRMPMPRVAVVESPSPNAFATGRNPSHAVVAVTTGIRSLLTDRELRAVLGHEMGHVRNRDILTSSIVATIAGAIQLIAQMLMFSALFGGRDRQNPLLSLVVILIAPIAATLIQLGISRTREYAADKTGAEVTGDPDALASALEKLQRGVQARPMAETPTQEAVSALYIVKPFAGGQGLSNLFSTHPPLEERIKRLREMRGSIR